MSSTATMPVQNGRKPLHERVPVEAITADARQARPGKTLLALIGAVIIAAAWTTAKIFGVLFLSAAWCASSWKYGWRVANGTSTKPTWDQLYAENTELRAMVERYQIG